MDPTLLFLLAALVVMLSAQPLARVLRLPVLTVYILAGLALGPSGLNFIRETAALGYLYRFGIILLMFTMGLKLKHPNLHKNRRGVFRFFIFNGLAAGTFMALVLIALFYPHRQPLLLILFVGAIFTSSSLEIVAPYLHELSYRSSHRVRSFISSLIGGTLLSEVTCLFLISLFIFYATKPGLALSFLVGVGIASYILLLLLGLPAFAAKVVSHPRVGRVSVQDQSRLLIITILVVVAVASTLKLHAIIAAFLAGIGLANLRIDRRVIQNIDFLASGMFIPIFFLTVGVKTDLSLFVPGSGWVYFASMAVSLIGVKVLSGFVLAQKEGFGIRESLGFGFATTPHLSSTLAAAIAGYEIGLLTPLIFNAVILASVLTTFLGPAASRPLLFPGTRRQEDYKDLEDYLSSDILPLELSEPLSSVMTHIRGLEISIYPVVDKKGVYQGVLHLSELRDILLGEELGRLVIVADLLYRDTPVLYRDEPLERAIAIFKECNCYAIPVLEATEEGDSYVGLVLLKDILPDLPIRLTA